jgi:hypothetical protein
MDWMDGLRELSPFFFFKSYLTYPWRNGKVLVVTLTAGEFGKTPGVTASYHWRIRERRR